MATGMKDLNLKPESSESVNQPSVQDKHVVTVPTDLSTSGAANAQGRRSHAPRRRQWRNPCSWEVFDVCSTSIQLILLAVFLSVFRDEHPHVALRVWAIGYGVVCLATLPLFYYAYKCYSPEQSDTLPRTVLVSLSFEIDVEAEINRRRRTRKILRCLWGIVDVFFALWWAVGVGIVDARWASREAPRLSWLCTAFLVFIFFRVVLPWVLYAVVRIVQCCGLDDWPRRAKPNVISALPTYKFHAQVPDLEANQASNNEEDDEVRNPRAGALAAEDVECFICLEPYEEGVVLKELPCTHHFHVKCIDRWLKISGSCPICKKRVGTSSTASASQPDDGVWV